MCNICTFDVVHSETFDPKRHLNNTVKRNTFVYRLKRVIIWFRIRPTNWASEFRLVTALNE